MYVQREATQLTQYMDQGREPNQMYVQREATQLT